MVGAAGLSFAIAIGRNKVAGAAALAAERTGKAMNPWVSIAPDGERQEPEATLCHDNRIVAGTKRQFAIGPGAGREIRMAGRSSGPGRGSNLYRLEASNRRGLRLS